MHRLIYKSLAKHDMAPSEIDEILTVARRRNEADGITGLLIYHQRMFLQILEGPEDRVNACYDRVRKDPRHSGVFKLSERSANKPAFSKWFMGYECPQDLSILTRRSALSLDQINDRLDALAKADIVEDKEALVQQLSRFLH